jgi:hypothetical protein
MKTLKIKPHVLEPQAIEATESTLKQLPNGGEFQRNPDGSYRIEDGWLFLDCTHPEFIQWAAVRQGYVAAVEPL